MDFKIGDRVIRTEDTYSQLPVGTITTVTHKRMHDIKTDAKDVWLFSGFFKLYTPKTWKEKLSNEVAK